MFKLFVLNVKRIILIVAVSYDLLRRGRYCSIVQGEDIDHMPVAAFIFRERESDEVHYSSNIRLYYNSIIKILILSIIYIIL